MICIIQTSKEDAVTGTGRWRNADMVRMRMPYDARIMEVCAEAREVKEAHSRLANKCIVDEGMRRQAREVQYEEHECVFE